MEKKGIIIGIVIALLIVVIGVTIFLVSKSKTENNTVGNSESEASNISDDENTKEPKDNSETIPSDTNTLNYIFTQ